MILVDTNVLIDVIDDDPLWADWSQQRLEAAAVLGDVAINDIVYAELSVGFETIDELESVIARSRLVLAPIPRLALFVAGKVYQRYRSAGGIRTSVLPDFFIGAHALVADVQLLTRDPRRYRTYFPAIDLIAPA